MTKEKKGKTKRDREEFPDLNEKTSLKLRRDYIDNRFYVNGIKNKGKLVIPELSHDDKKFLNQFNKEYYSASFRKEDNDNRLHISHIDNDTIQDIKNQIRELKSVRKKIWDKSPNKTTEKDREEARVLTYQIDEMEEFLNFAHPKRACEHANNQRNRCFLNRNKASNEFKLVSWEELDPDNVAIDSNQYIDYILDLDDDEN